MTFWGPAQFVCSFLLKYIELIFHDFPLGFILMICFFYATSVYTHASFPIVVRLSYTQAGGDVQQDKNHQESKGQQKTLLLLCSIFQLHQPKRTPPKRSVNPMGPPTPEENKRTRGGYTRRPWSVLRASPPTTVWSDLASLASRDPGVPGPPRRGEVSESVKGGERRKLLSLFFRFYSGSKNVKVWSMDWIKPEQCIKMSNARLF